MPPFVKDGGQFELCRDAFNSIVKSGAAGTDLSFLKEKRLMACKLSSFVSMLLKYFHNFSLLFYTKKDKKFL